MISKKNEFKERLKIILEEKSRAPKIGRRWLFTASAAALCAIGLISCMQPKTNVDPDAAQIEVEATASNAVIILDCDAQDNWRRGAEVDGVEYLRVQGVSHTGAGSLCLKKTAQRYFPIAQWTRSVADQSILQARQIKVSAWVKAEDARKAILDAQFTNLNGDFSHEWAAYIGVKEEGDAPANHDWKRYEGIVNIPDGTTEITIGLQIYGPGTVWFDDIEVSGIQ